MAGFSSGFDYGFSVAVGALARRPRLRWELFEVYYRASGACARSTWKVTARYPSWEPAS